MGGDECGARLLQLAGVHQDMSWLLTSLANKLYLGCQQVLLKQGRVVVAGTHLDAHGRLAASRLHHGLGAVVQQVGRAQQAAKKWYQRWVLQAPHRSWLRCSRL